MKDRRYGAAFLVVFGALGIAAIQDSPVLTGVMAALVLAGIALFLVPFFTGRTGQDAPMGRSEGDTRGPEAGEGGEVHASTGTQDFDGQPGDALPPRRDGEGEPVDPPPRGTV